MYIYSTNRILTLSSQLELDSGAKELKLTREVDGGLESLSMNLPSVVTCDLRLNTPRFLAIPNIMKVRTTKLRSIAHKIRFSQLNILILAFSTFLGP
jgi:electron transfer flavoprotein alpha/beta subunit